MELRSEINVKNKDDIIPKDWIPIRLGELADITSSKRIFAKEYSESGIPFYRGKEIIEKFNGKKISEDLYIKKSKYQEIKEKYGVPEEGDMLLTSVGTLGIPYLVKKHEKFYFKDGNLTWFRNFNDKVNNYFVYYWIISDLGRKQLECHKIGSTQQALTIEGLKNFKINLPSNQEQDVIIEILSSLDDKIELNRKINSNLEKITSLLFKQWFVDFEFPNENGKPFKSSGGRMIDSELGEIPYSWTVGKIGDCFDIKYGKSDKDISEDGAYSVYGAGGILGFSNTFDYKGPQVIVGCRGTCGNISIIFEDSKITHNSLIISNEWRNFFLYLYLKNINIKDVITGSTQPQITIKDLSSLNVLLPSKEIVDTFSQIIDPLFLNIKTNLLENIYLNKIRDSLLPRLMSGKIRVKI